MSINKIPVKAFTAGDLVLDTFTATAGQTAFTLSVASTNNSVIVTVNDVLQVPPEDYTVNGTTLTFTSALELDDEVVVRIVSRPSTFGTVEDGAISSAKLATGAIEAKLGYTPVSPTQLNNLIDSAPTALDTLNELAAALNDDANFVSTMTTALSLKVSKDSDTGAAIMPVGTSSQRPITPQSGMFRLNSTTGEPEWYDTTSLTWINFADPRTYQVETLVIAGGGAGGNGYYGGGGGAGGYLYGFNSIVSRGTAFIVTVGAGGSASTSLSTSGGSGSNSSINGSIAQTAVGGGGAGSRNQTSGQTGVNGGSGGGAAWPGATGGSSTAGQGYAGGNTGAGYGSGGGGAGGVGGPAFNDAYLGSYGGPGLNTHSDWASATSSGVSGYYAGGGGAGTRSGAPTNHYYGGVGGGGNGGVQGGSTPIAGVVNTGSGGGGADTGDSYTGDSHNRGASGGSGIVIIRYIGAQRGVGGTITSSVGYTYHTFTSSGTFTA